MPEFRRGLVALSADPITFGHLDLIERAAERCDRLVVLVAMNERKAGKYVFTLKERRQMTERAIRERRISDVTVIASDGLLVDVYLREGCDAVFRGVRNADDLDYEETMAELNGLILPDLEGRFVYIESKPEYRNLSSTTVKAFVEGVLDVDRFVPIFVKQMLEERMLGQYRLGITGSIAVGKSWVAEQLVEAAKGRGIESMHLNVDALLRKLYDEDSPGAQIVRDTVAGKFGDAMLSDDRLSVNRAALASKLFEGKDAERDRAFIVELTMPHVQRLYREALWGRKGLVVVEWAQMAEMGMGFWTNNNVVVVDSPDRAKFAEMRSINQERLDALSRIQMTGNEKATELVRQALSSGSGKVFQHPNSIRKDPEETKASLRRLLDMILIEAFPSLET